MQQVRNWRHGWLGCCLVLAAGCGYLKSGTWEDNRANWERAFDSTKPGDVVVVHSLYWRSPHWSYEAGYVFEIAANARLRQQLFSENRLVKLDGSAAAESNFRVLIDRDTGTIFLTDFQI